MMGKRKIWIMWVLIFLCGEAIGKVLEVPEQYLSIQSAIDSASHGDTVSVRPGRIDNPAVYYENINFKGKNIIVSARNLDWFPDPSKIDNPDPRATVIDGSNPQNPDSALGVYFIFS